MIVVRESNGTLRKAINDEREKVLQVYFPREGKTAHVPQMFSRLQLEVISYETLKLNDFKFKNRYHLKFSFNKKGMSQDEKLFDFA